MSIYNVLQPVTFGQRVAEEEVDSLSSYFVETDHWKKLYSDTVDIIYGPKGAGKSALYSLVVGRKNDLFDRKILTAVAENPRGATAFKALVVDPPASETEFIALWKLYVACLISKTLDDYGVSSESSVLLKKSLGDAGFLLKENNLQRILGAAFEYVKRIMRPTAVAGEIKIDPLTQMPVGVGGKIVFAEPTSLQEAQGVVSVDRLLELGNNAFSGTGYSLWILLDRLDVAFLESPELEKNALRALFHVYLDLLSFKNVKLKIFLRTDIWRRITDEGFREASHITRHLTIEWNKSTMLNLIIRRAVQNEHVVAHYGETKENILASSENQEKFFYRLFPNQVEAGPRKPTTLDWILGRTSDAFRQAAPREVIHLLNALRDAQVRKLEVGEPEPEGGRLFSRAVFREALPEVSRVRLGQTLYAEYPEVKENIEKLRGEKTQYSIISLAEIWGVTEEVAFKNARNLCEIGFFEQRGEKDTPIFWVPMLYRDALGLVQGSAD